MVLECRELASAVPAGDARGAEIRLGLDDSVPGKTQCSVDPKEYGFLADHRRCEFDFCGGQSDNWTLATPPSVVWSE